jgi:hypothetical protein
MSGGVCETRHGNGSTEHHSAVRHHFFVKLGDSATATNGKLQVFGDDAMSRTSLSPAQYVF